MEELSTVSPSTADEVAIILELVPDSEETSPAVVHETGRSLVESLQREGYDLRPVYTGTRGGPFLVEVANAITQAAAFVWANRATVEEVTNDTSALVTIMGAAIPLVRRVFHAHETQVGKDEEAIRPIKISVMIDGTPIEVEARDIAQADAALALARKFATAHPQTARQVSAKSKTRVRGQVPSRPRRRSK